MKLTFEGELGMDANRVREIRLANMCQDRDFVIRANKGIYYTEKGLALLQAELGKKKTAAGASVAVAAREEREESPCALRVVRMCPNPTWVWARRAAEEGRGSEGPILQCRVRNNRKMWLGTILAVCHKQPDGRWYHAK